MKAPSVRTLVLGAILFLPTIAEAGWCQQSRRAYYSQPRYQYRRPVYVAWRIPPPKLRDRPRKNLPSRPTYPKERPLSNSQYRRQVEAMIRADARRRPELAWIIPVYLNKMREAETESEWREAVRQYKDWRRDHDTQEQ